MTDHADLECAHICQENLHVAYRKITIFVSRNWKFFFWRIYFVMFVVTTMTVVVFLFTSIGEQFGLLSTAVLNTVAYLYYIGSFIPVVKYNTLMDLYIYGFIFFKFMVGLQFLWLGLQEGDNGGSVLTSFKEQKLYSFVNLCIVGGGHIIKICYL